MIRYPLLWLLAGTGLALTSALLIVNANIELPDDKLQTFVVALAASAFATSVLAYVSYQFELIRWFPSIRLALVAIIMVTVVLITLNVWVTVQLMFISQHDLVITAALLVFAGIMASLFGAFVASAMTRRINALSHAAEELAAGKLETRLEASGVDELAVFARRFNWMAESLQQIDEEKRRVEKTRRDLIAGVSHDLRTPLTSVRAMLEAINDGVVDDDETVERYMKNSLLEINNLSHLIDDLFQLAQLDAGHVDATFENASLRDLISDLISTMNAKAKRQYIKLSCEVAENIDPVYMAPTKIQRVLYNLMDNAIRYTPAYGEVTLTAFVKNEQVHVAVHNTGDAIDPMHLPRIFESFYRGESSRVQAEDGHRSTGLGLAIAQRFVQIHRGKITVESLPGIGTTFRFVIPRLPQVAALTG